MLQGECTNSAVGNQTHKAHVFAVANLDTLHLHAGVKIWTHNCGNTVKHGNERNSHSSQEELTAVVNIVQIMSVAEISEGPNSSCRDIR